MMKETICNMTIIVIDVGSIFKSRKENNQKLSDRN